MRPALYSISDMKADSLVGKRSLCSIDEAIGDLTASSVSKLNLNSCWRSRDRVEFMWVKSGDMPMSWQSCEFQGVL